MRLRRRLGLGAAALVTAVGLSACQVSSPVATDFEYDPANGISFWAGAVQLLDVQVVSTGVGELGVIAGYAVNDSGEPVSLEMALETEEGERIPLTPSVEVPANSALRLDGYDVTTGEFTDPLLIPEVPVRAGQLITVRVTTGAEAASARVPILLPDYPYGAYTEILAADG